MLEIDRKQDYFNSPVSIKAAIKHSREMMNDGGRDQVWIGLSYERRRDFKESRSYVIPFHDRSKGGKTFTALYGLSVPEYHKVLLDEFEADVNRSKLAKQMGLRDYTRLLELVMEGSMPSDTLSAASWTYDPLLDYDTGSLLLSCNIDFKPSPLRRVEEIGDVRWTLEREKGVWVKSFIHASNKGDINNG